MAKLKTKYVKDVLLSLGVDLEEGHYRYHPDTGELFVHDVSDTDILDAEAALDIPTIKAREKAEKDNETKKIKDISDAKSSTPTTLQEVIDDLERIKRILGIK